MVLQSCALCSSSHKCSLVHVPCAAYARYQLPILGRFVLDRYSMHIGFCHRSTFVSTTGIRGVYAAEWKQSSVEPVIEPGTVVEAAAVHVCFNRGAFNGRLRCSRSCMALHSGNGPWQSAHLLLLHSGDEAGLYHVLCMLYLQWCAEAIQHLHVQHGEIIWVAKPKPGQVQTARPTP